MIIPYMIWIEKVIQVIVEFVKFGYSRIKGKPLHAKMNYWFYEVMVYAINASHC